MLLDGQPITSVSRDRGIVFQKYSLFSHLTVLENIAYGPLLEYTSICQRVCTLRRIAGVRQQALEEARNYLGRIGLNLGDGDKYP